MSFKEECICFSIALAIFTVGILLGLGLLTFVKMFEAAFLGGI